MIMFTRLLSFCQQNIAKSNGHFNKMDVYLDKDFVSPFIHPLASRLVLATDLAGHEQLLPRALGGASLCHSMGIRFHPFMNIHALALQ